MLGLTFLSLCATLAGCLGVGIVWELKPTVHIFERTFLSIDLLKLTDKLVFCFVAMVGYLKTNLDRRPSVRW